MKCSKCGFENVEDAKFCRKCGNELEVSGGVPENTSNVSDEEIGGDSQGSVPWDNNSGYDSNTIIFFAIFLLLLCFLLLSL